MSNKTYEDKIIRLPEVLTRTSFSRSHLYDLVSKKQFPAPIKLSPRHVGWLSSEVTSWLGQRVAERDQKKVSA